MSSSALSSKPSKHREWREQLTGELLKFEQLPAGSGSYGPHRPPDRAVESLNALLDSITFDQLPLALLSASPDGVITLEWRVQNRTLSFFVFEDGAIEAYAQFPERAPFELELVQDRLGQVNELLAPFAR